MRPAFFTVTTVDLTEDLLSARHGLGPRPIGAMDGPQLTLVLEKSLRAELGEDPAARPQLLVATPARTFVVTLTRGQLVLHDASSPAASLGEYPPAGIVAEMERLSGPASEPRVPVEKQRMWIRRAIGILVLLFAAGVTSYTVYMVSRVDNVDAPPIPTPVTDARELAALRNSAVGRYATGNRAGDRRIEISADGQIRFIRVTENGERPESDDSYRLGRLDGKLWLSTTESGPVQIINIDTLEYWHDVYRRVR